MATMKIELRNVKHAAFASEETDCFTATIYIDGARAGEVSNDGHGGCNMYHPHGLETRINDYAKTLPKIDCLYLGLQENDPHRFMEQDADTLIGEIFNEYMANRDLKKLLTKRIAFAKVGGKGVFQTKVLDKATIDRLLADAVYRAKQEAEGFQILNLMPFADALAIYRKGA